MIHSDLPEPTMTNGSTGSEYDMNSVITNGNGGHETVATLGRINGDAFQARNLRILMLGAGISGIQLAHDVTTQMDNYELEIYEKNSGLGGTWFENKYPGCACDVPAHTYQFAWEPNTRWSKFYAPAPEICQYLNAVVDKHDLRKYMHFNHRAVHAEWHEESSTWRVHLETAGESGQPKIIVKECDVFVQGVGTLNAWRYPDIEGLLQYKGALMHTATWDDKTDLTGKRVAVIGNGASAVQCVAALQPVVGKLYNYMRTASWMLPHLFSDGAVQKECESNHVQNVAEPIANGFPDEADLVEKFEKDPEFYYEYRRKLEVTLASGFEALWRGSTAQNAIRDITIQHMKETISDQKMLGDLIPEFEVGCRRFTPGDHYLHALQQSNVSMVSDRIVRVTETGIEDATGALCDVDVIICATGFDASYEPRFPTFGRGGYSLAENWGKDKQTESYMGAAVAHFPNLFVFNPPICPVIGSAFPGIAATSNYIMRIINRLQHDSLKSVVVKQPAQTEFNEWAQDRMQGMAWAGDCKSWYKNSKGKVFVPWPGTILHYVRTTELVRWEDFDFVWDKKNKYASLGNGVTKEGFAAENPPWLKPDSGHKKEGAAAVALRVADELPLTKGVLVK